MSPWTKHHIWIRVHRHPQSMNYGIVAIRSPPNCPLTDELYRNRAAATTMAAHCHSISRVIRPPASRTAMLWSMISATMDWPASALRCIRIHVYWCRCRCPTTNRIVWLAPMVAMDVLRNAIMISLSTSIWMWQSWFGWSAARSIDCVPLANLPTSPI